MSPRVPLLLRAAHACPTPLRILTPVQGGEVPTALHDACEPSDPDAGPRRRAAQAEGRARVALRLLAAGANPNARDQVLPGGVLPCVKHGATVSSPILYLLILRTSARLLLLLTLSLPCMVVTSTRVTRAVLLICTVTAVQFGRTPLFSASYVGREDVVRALLRAGAAVDCTDKVSVALSQQTACNRNVPRVLAGVFRATRPPGGCHVKAGRLLLVLQQV